MALGGSAPSWQNQRTGVQAGGGTSPRPQSSAQTAYSRGYGAPPSSPTYNTPAVESPFKSIFDSRSNYYAPDMAYNAFQRDMAGQDAAAQARYFGQQEGGLRTDYNLGIRSLGIDERSLGIDRGGAQRDIGYYQQMLGNMGQHRDLAGRDLLNQWTKLQRQGNAERIGINSDATARGSWLGPMREFKYKDSYDQQRTAAEGARIGYDSNMLGLSEKEAGLKKSLGGSQDAYAKLGLESERLGVQRDKLKANLDQGLAQLGYNRFTSSQQLLERMASSNRADAEMARKIFEEAVGLTNSLSGGQFASAYGSFGG